MFRRAIELRPAFWQNQSALGTFFLRRGRLDDAKLIFRKVIELNPQKTNAYINLASVHMMAGEWSSAEPLLLAAIKMDSSASAHNNLGVVYFSMARFEDAAREFRAAIDSGYAFAEPYGNMGDAYRFLGQQQKAKAAYGRAVELWDVRLKLNDKDVEGRIGLSKHLACLGLCTKARKQSQRALELASEQPMVQYNAAISYAICGDRNAAIRHLARALTGGITSDVYTNPDLATILRDPSIQALLARIPNRRTAPNSTDR
jgi:Flp pilus assembly protein TadD